MKLWLCSVLVCVSACAQRSAPRQLEPACQEFARSWDQFEEDYAWAVAHPERVPRLTRDGMHPVDQSWQTVQQTMFAACADHYVHDADKAAAREHFRLAVHQLNIDFDRPELAPDRIKAVISAVRAVISRPAAER
ncbi:MAG: hypothetical protein IT370_00500 [Deltaproteobacteria bacterium]|nr:hypothetical protein [Deltaproteobacteria bacterium]